MEVYICSGLVLEQCVALHALKLRGGVIGVRTFALSCAERLQELS